MAADGPRQVYQALHLQHSAAASALAARERRLSSSRLLVFVGTVAFLLAAFDTGWYSPWWTLLPVAGFGALIVAHDRVIRARRHAERAARFYGSGLARVEDRWAGQGNAGERFLDPHHPYSADLDIFGRGSLFELLCTARTHAGEDTLAGWLMAPAAPAVVRRRQAAVAELQPRLQLREDLALLGEDVRAALNPQSLATWGGAPPLFTSDALGWVALLLVALTAAAALAFGLGYSPRPLLLMVVLEAAFGALLQPRVSKVLQAAQHPDRDLALFGGLLGRLEQEKFESEHLVGLRAALDSAGEPPSRRIARLHRLIHLLDARKNQMFAPISGFLLWGTQCALAIEAWRATTGPVIGRWLEVVAEMEALGALSGYAYEHPDDPFPELVDSGPVFRATAIGHPLIAAARCVRNDLALGNEPRVLVVSGSNMSGKSTLLRSVGVNAVLAFAGAPVRAAQLSLSPLTLGASIRTLDSLQEGTSRFYAEIKRLRQLMDLCGGEQPLLFLLDEILHGTNSHDRGIGAEAIVRGFLKRGAIGLVTTHDLALTRVADVLSPATANVHFEDQMHDGEMRFDYRMQPGVVTHSNALALMRAVGLEV